MVTLNFTSNKYDGFTQNFECTDDAKEFAWELFQMIMDTMQEKTGFAFNPCEIEISSFNHDYKLYDIVSYDDSVTEWQIEIIH
jgi:hypothetical protein